MRVTYSFERDENAIHRDREDGLVSVDAMNAVSAIVAECQGNPRAINERTAFDDERPVISFEIPDTIDVDALRDPWERILRLHALRAAYLTDPGG